MAALIFETKIPLVTCALNFLEIFVIQKLFGFYQAYSNHVVVFVHDGFSQIQDMEIMPNYYKYGTYEGKKIRNKNIQRYENKSI